MVRHWVLKLVHLLAQQREMSSGMHWVHCLAQHWAHCSEMHWEMHLGRQKAQM